MLMGLARRSTACFQEDQLGRKLAIGTVVLVLEELKLTRHGKNFQNLLGHRRSIHH